MTHNEADNYNTWTQENPLVPHSDWLVLVYASCHAEAQSHPHLLMENHHLHGIVVLGRGRGIRLLFNMTKVKTTA